MDGPVAVSDLAAVEAALGRLWQATAAGGDRAVLRAATFNLVAIVACNAEGQEAARVLADVTAHQPGRVLILSLDPGARADRLEAWVTTHCRMIGEGTQVCGEQVIISAAGGAVERLAAAVPVLFVPDCPAMAWWRCGAGPATAFLQRLLPSVDAVLIDGSRFDAATLPDWTSRLGRGSEPVTLGDLAWERAAPWRAWLADCFESRERRRALHEVGAVRVEHGPGAGIVGWLFVAWLADRLGWHGRGGRLVAPGGAAVEVAVGQGAGTGGLTAVSLEPRGGRGLRCVLERRGDASVALTLADGGAVVTQQVFRRREADEVALVGAWLERPRRDPVYGEALAKLAALAPEVRP